MTATTLHSLHYTTTTTPLRYNYNYSCSTSHYIQQLWVRWPLQPLQPFQQTQLQPPFGQSVDLLCHPWFTTTNVSYRFPILKLPPPPCAILLVFKWKPPYESYDIVIINDHVIFFRPWNRRCELRTEQFDPGLTIYGVVWKYCGWLQNPVPLGNYII